MQNSARRRRRWSRVILPILEFHRELPTNRESALGALAKIGRSSTDFRQGAQGGLAIRGKLPMKFQYRQYHTTPSPTAPSGILHRPEIALRIIGSTGAVSLWALVDAGSDDTLFPLSVAQMIGASVDPTQT